MKLRLSDGREKKRDYGANIKGFGCTQIEVDLFEFLEYAKEHGEEKAIRYLRLELMTLIFEGGTLAIVWRNYIFK